MIRSLKPASAVLYKRLDHDLGIIKAGENKINESFKGVSSEYSRTMEEFKDLSNRSAYLANFLKEKAEQSEALDEKLEEVNAKITLATNDSENNRVSEIKSSIRGMGKEIREMEQREGILLWQLKKYLLEAKKDKAELAHNDFFDE